jgi:hypothetical protein
MDAGLVFRWVDATNYWRIIATEVAGVKFLRLVRVVAGVATQVAEVREPGWVTTNTIELVVDLYNDGISMQYNGQEAVHVYSEVHRTGRSYGLYSNNDQLTRFNNFHIEESGGTAR